MAQPEELKNIEVRNQVFLERYKNGVSREFSQVIALLGKETRDAILLLGVERISDLTKRELNILIAELRTLAMDLVSVQIGDFMGELSKLSTQQAKFEVGAVKAVAENVVISTPPSGSAFTFANNIEIRATGDLPSKFFSSMSRNEADQLARVVRKGYSDGLTTPQMVSRVRGTSIARFSDGYTKQAKQRVEAQVHTAVQHYSQRSREKVWNDNSDIIEGYAWLSTLDSRTTTQCKSLDGRKFEVGRGPVPPLHWRCRSTTVPLLDESLDFLDTDATRSSETGPVDANLDYYDWLKQQPKNFQNEAIGPARAKLLRDGGLSADQFAKLNLNRNFEPLTLKEMEKKSPIAFERAMVEV